MIDVGQGDGLLVISPDGFTLLVDSGSESEAANVSSYLAAVGVSNLDYTLVSHLHSDHLGAMDLVLGDHTEVVACFDHGGSYTTTEYNEYAAAAGSRRTALQVGETIDLGTAVVAEVLHSDVGSGEENLNSVVLKLTYGSHSLLLGGDCEGPCESSFDPGPVQIYKVHHHGSNDSSTDGFLAAMDPRTALISVGAGNPYGHPHPETLDRLAAHGATVYRTDLDGDLVVVSDGVSYTVNNDPVCVAEVCSNGLDDDCDGLTDGADPDCGGGADHVVIAQVGYDTPGTDALEEFVDLYNPTGSAQSLDGWTLSDNVGTWDLPVGTSIAADAYLSIARDPATFDSLYGFAPDVSGMSLDLGNSGDRLILADSSGEVDRVAWENEDPGWSITAGTGDSIERADPTVDTDTVEDWSVTSPASPRGGTVTDCGNGVCDAGEDCETCSADCPGVTKGKPSGRYCCGNGTCEPVGEDAEICPIDCG
jgi:beta-lactamase superfamily II metal-dependent hydrolase